MTGDEKKNTDSELEAAEPAGRKEIKFHYQKSRHFRVIHADGAHGGVAPTGFIHFAFYNERGAIPRVSKIDLTPGVDRTERPIEILDGPVREVEVDVIMDINAGASFYRWLREKLELLRQGLKIPDDEWAKMLKGRDE